MDRISDFFASKKPLVVFTTAGYPDPVRSEEGIAAAVENAATDVGLNVPNDVEVLSLVGTKYAYICRPTLTSFHIDMIEAGKRAMYMLTDLLNNELEEKTARIEPRLYHGQSTKK